jgi:transposase InsO family protein
MKGATLLATLDRLGVVPSRSRPRVSNDNPFSESLFSTLKGQPDYPDGPFISIEQARAWVASFVAWYNTEHLHSEIRYVTPDSRHAGLDAKILSKRHKVYERARAENPERWSGDTRDWTQIREVYLNHTDRPKTAKISARNPDALEKIKILATIQEGEMIAA